MTMHGSMNVKSKLHYLCLLRFTKGAFEFLCIGPFSETGLYLPTSDTSFEAVCTMDSRLLTVISLTECINFTFVNIWVAF